MSKPKQPATPRSRDALQLQDELTKWAEEAWSESRQPWLDDIAAVIRHSRSGDHYKAVQCLIIASQRPSGAASFLEGAALNAGKLYLAHEHCSQSKDRAERRKASDLLQALDELLDKVYAEMLKYQKQLYTAQFDQTRTQHVVESLNTDNVRQSQLVFQRQTVRQAISCFAIPLEVLNRLYGFTNWDSLEYVDLTGAWFNRLNDDSELSEVLKGTSLDLSTLGGLVSHSPVVIAIIKRILGEGRPFANPLILLKTDFTLATLAHELTHACINHLDAYLHERQSQSVFPYADNPEERLAFIHGVLWHQFLYPRDTFDEYIRIQTRMNLDGENIIKTGLPHGRVQRDIWVLLEQAGRLTAANIVQHRNAAIERFIAPVLNVRSYTLLSTSSQEANRLLVAATQAHRTGDLATAADLYQRALATAPSIGAVVNPRLAELQSLTFDSLVRKGASLIVAGNYDEGETLLRDLLKNAKGSKRSEIEALIRQSEQGRRESQRNSLRTRMKANLREFDATHAAIEFLKECHPEFAATVVRLLGLKQPKRQVQPSDNDREAQPAALRLLDKMCLLRGIHILGIRIDHDQGPDCTAIPTIGPRNDEEEYIQRESREKNRMLWEAVCQLSFSAVKALGGHECVEILEECFRFENYELEWGFAAASTLKELSLFSGKRELMFLQSQLRLSEEEPRKVALERLKELGKLTPEEEIVYYRSESMYKWGDAQVAAIDKLLDLEKKSEDTVCELLGMWRTRNEAKAAAERRGCFTELLQDAYYGASLHSRDVALVREAKEKLSQLYRFGPERQIVCYTKLLEDGTTEDAIEAIRRLAVLATGEAWELLERKLKVPGSMVKSQIQAYQELASVFREAGKLNPDLESGYLKSVVYYAQESSVAAVALQQYGDLPANLQEPVDARYIAVMKSDGDANELLEALSERVRRRKDPGLIENLSQILQESGWQVNTRVQIHAAKCLGKIANDAARDALIAAVRGGQIECNVFDAVADALVESGCKQAAPAIELLALRGKNLPQAVSALERLDEMDEGRRQRVAEFLLTRERGVELDAFAEEYFLAMNRRDGTGERNTRIAETIRDLVAGMDAAARRNIVDYALGAFGQNRLFEHYAGECMAAFDENEVIEGIARNSGNSKRHLEGNLKNQFAKLRAPVRDSTLVYLMAQPAQRDILISALQGIKQGVSIGPTNLKLIRKLLRSDYKWLRRAAKNALSEMGRLRWVDRAVFAIVEWSNK